LLVLMVTLMAKLFAPAAADDIALVAQLTDGIGISLVVVFADLQLGEHLPRSLQLYDVQIYESVFRYVYTKMDGWPDICQKTCGLDIQLMELSLLRCCGVQ